MHDQCPLNQENALSWPVYFICASSLLEICQIFTISGNAWLFGQFIFNKLIHIYKYMYSFWKYACLSFIQMIS